MLLLLFIIGNASAVSLPLNNSITSNSLNALFHNYLLFYFPGSTINASVFFKYQNNTNSYIIMQLKTSNQTYLLINTSNNKYKLILNNSQALSIFNAIFSKTNFVNQTDISKLKQQMNQFNNESNINISKCLYITGLTRHVYNTNNISNYSQACSTVPGCRDTMEAYGGPVSPFGYGIMNFSKQYFNLNTSYLQYFSMLSSINNSNFAQKLGLLNSSLNNISAITQKMPQNPLFPLNKTIYSLLSTCQPGELPLQSQWYCNDIGYCPAISFNYSLLTSSHQIINNELSSKQIIPSLAATSVNLANTYSQTAIQKYNTSQYNQLMNKTGPLYYSIINKSDTLLTKFNDTNLSLSVSNLSQIFSSIKSKTLYQNLTVANTSLVKAINNTQNQYENAESMYLQIQNLSLNNTAVILKDELNFKYVPYSLAYLGSQQQLINLMLANKINANNANSIVTELISIKKSLNSISVPSYGFLVSLKSFSEPFVKAIMSINIPVYLKLQFAYILVPIFFIILGVIALIILYIIYIIFKIKNAHKGKKPSHLWKLIFFICFIIIIIIAYYTYIAAEQANNFLPINSFANQMTKSSIIAIAVPTSTSSASCVSSLQNNISKEGKTSVLVVINSTCNLLYNSQCIDTYLSRNIPLIYINLTSNVFLSYKGLYGTILFANNSSTLNPQCFINKLLFSSKK